MLLFLVVPLMELSQGQEPAPILSERTAPEARQVLEQQTFYLINQYRREQHLALLIWNDNIARQARSHSQDMATGKVDFGHDGFKERIDQLKEVIAGIKGAGENVFETDDPEQVATSAVKHWLESPPHLHNIRGEYNYSGLGLWEGEGGRLYFTQIFVKVNPPAIDPPVAAPEIFPFLR